MKQILSILIVALIIACGGDNSNTSVPILTTTSISSISGSEVECGGTITSDGGATVMERGVCWGTKQTPTISNNKTADGDGAGTFKSEISGLTPGTKYYFRAYASNSSGTGYGSTMSFTPTLTKLDHKANMDAVEGMLRSAVVMWASNNLMTTGTFLYPPASAVTIAAMIEDGAIADWSDNAAGIWTYSPGGTVWGRLSYTQTGGGTDYTIY